MQSVYLRSFSNDPSSCRRRVALAGVLLGDTIADDCHLRQVALHIEARDPTDEFARYVTGEIKVRVTGFPNCYIPGGTLFQGLERIVIIAKPHDRTLEIRSVRRFKLKKLGNVGFSDRMKCDV